MKQVSKAGLLIKVGKVVWNQGMEWGLFFIVGASHPRVPS